MPRSSAIPPGAVAPHDRERALPAAARPRGRELSAAPARRRAREGGLLPPARLPPPPPPPRAGTRRPPPAACNGRCAPRPVGPQGGRGGGSPSRAGSRLPAAPKGSAPSQRDAGSRGSAGAGRRGPPRPEPSGRRAVPRRGRDRPSIARPVAKSRPRRARPSSARPGPGLKLPPSPAAPPSPEAGKGGRGTCAKRCWGGGERRAAGRRAPQPLPGWGEGGAEPFPALGVAADVKPSPPSYLTASPPPMASSAPGTGGGVGGLEPKKHPHEDDPPTPPQTRPARGGRGGTKQNLTPLPPNKIGVWGRGGTGGPKVTGPSKKPDPVPRPTPSGTPARPPAGSDR